MQHLVFNLQALCN